MVLAKLNNGFHEESASTLAVMFGGAKGSMDSVDDTFQHLIAQTCAQNVHDLARHGAVSITIKRVARPILRFTISLSAGIYGLVCPEFHQTRQNNNINAGHLKTRAVPLELAVQRIVRPLVILW